MASSSISNSDCTDMRSALQLRKMTCSGVHRRRAILQGGARRCRVYRQLGQPPEAQVLEHERPSVIRPQVVYLHEEHASVEEGTMCSHHSAASLGGKGAQIKARTDMPQQGYHA